VKRNQGGATAIEFCLVLITFLAVMLAIVDFARMLYTWNAANEAARAGARYAIVCDNTGFMTAVRTRMQAMLPNIQTITTTWDPAGCNPTSCIGVRVQITGMTYNFMSPIAGLADVGAIPMPTFATYVTREDMRSDANAGILCP
jgi:Flp pilus assembly protein TadG